MSERETPTADEVEGWVRLARAGDHKAFERLYRQHHGRVYALCLRMTADPALAEDCTQAVFIQAWEKLAGFQMRSAFGTWLHRIAVNEVLARRRKEGRQRRHLELVEDADQEQVPDPRRERVGTRMDLEAAIGKLPVGARDVLVLHEICGFSHEESAAMLGVAVGTCKAQLHRARRLLRTRLEQ